MKRREECDEEKPQSKRVNPMHWETYSISKLKIQMKLDNCWAAFWWEILIECIGVMLVNKTMQVPHHIISASVLCVHHPSQGSFLDYSAEKNSLRPRSGHLKMYRVNQGRHLTLWCELSVALCVSNIKSFCRTSVSEGRGCCFLKQNE